MRFIHLSPGAGENFYCENCLRDSAMVLALRRRGHDAWSVPLYLPLMTDQAVGEQARGEVFFGGINVYLQQKSALFRRTPRWLDRLFDSRRLLRWAGRRAGMTDAREVAETMLSMLRGEQGRQVKELDRLVAFLAEQGRPDMVSLSNVLLAGLARRMKRQLGAAVVGSLQDEEGYVEALPEPYRSEAWDELRRQCAELDAFIAPSRFYAETMQKRLRLPAGRFHVVPNAVDTAGLAPPAAPPAEPAVGYLAQMSEGKGLETLVEAFCRLRADGRHPRLKLKVCGGMTAAEEPVVRRVRRRLREANLQADATFTFRCDGAEKVQFLQSCSVLSVPTRRGEAFGLFVLEALACGVPVVLPAHGAFPELIEATGGGLLCEPNDPADLAGKIEMLLSDPAGAAEKARRGRAAVLEKFTPDRMAEGVERVCREVLARRGEAAGERPTDAGE